ncbi:MFS transporter [Oceanicoccus sp. KOV_DT_Chl]|uniref:MFS transporter n=1 Tax=Oceanicoccus sp. KOV_DT_Chl TaxID=1904639 RepID=UPI00350F31B5
MISQELKQTIFNRRMLICVFTGFASGLPLYILFQLVPAWLRTEGVGLKEIGFFSLIQLPYAWKFVWAPLLDRYTPLSIGRRRSWMLITQLALLVLVACLGFFSPLSQLSTIAMLSVAVAFFSATQDVTLDAYRRELLPDVELGLGNSIHVQAYRISGLIPGALSLILADYLPWQSVFIITAGFMLVGVAMTLVIKEAMVKPLVPKGLREAIITPFKDFFQRNSWQGGLLVLAFFFL